MNGVRVTQPVALKDSDQIEVGSVTMTYRLMDPLPIDYYSARNVRVFPLSPLNA